MRSNWSQKSKKSKICRKIKNKNIEKNNFRNIFYKNAFLGGQVFYECLFSTIKLWTTTPILWPMLTGGRCSEIVLCHKN